MGLDCYWKIKQGKEWIDNPAVDKALAGHGYAVPGGWFDDGGVHYFRGSGFYHSGLFKRLGITPARSTYNNKTVQRMAKKFTARKLAGHYEELSRMFSTHAAHGSSLICEW